MRRPQVAAAFIAVVLLAGLLGLRTPQEISEDQELTEIHLTGWNCINRLGGSGRSPETVERNTLKNRWAVDLSSLAVKSFDTAGFLKHVADFDAETKGKRRKDLTPDEKRRLEILEAPIVSLTGYLVLAYAGPPETCNCSSMEFHDWHLEIFEEPVDHPPQPGDPTPVICEITPRTQNAIYMDGIRIQELAAFFRRTDMTYESTGHKGQKVRLTEYLLWDDEHNDVKDVGTTIHSIARNRYHNPWRATAWEIHPVIKIERLDETTPHPDSRRSPASEEATAPSPSGQTSSPIPAATAQTYVTTLHAVKIKVAFGETVLAHRLRLPIVSRDQQTVTIHSMGENYAIPITATDLR